MPCRSTRQPSIALQIMILRPAPAAHQYTAGLCWPQAEEITCHAVVIPETATALSRLRAMTFRSAGPTTRPRRRAGWSASSLRCSRPAPEPIRPGHFDMRQFHDIGEMSGRGFARLTMTLDCETDCRHPRHAMLRFPGFAMGRQIAEPLVHSISTRSCNRDTAAGRRR